MCESVSRIFSSISASLNEGCVLREMAEISREFPTSDVSYEVNPESCKCILGSANLTALFVFFLLSALTNDSSSTIDRTSTLMSYKRCILTYVHKSAC